MNWIYLWIYLLSLSVQATTSYWWSIGQVKFNDIPHHVLLNLHRFTRRQKLMLKTTPKLLETMGRAASLSILECKRQFQYRKWNCSTYQSASVFGNILTKACRETAFIYSITSAGATYALTESCAKGLLKDCYCHQPSKANKSHLQTKKHHIYEGCHDNIQYGYGTGKLFVDATIESHDFHAYVNLHNNEAGRQAVINSMVIRCKCHGVSGNCNMKTCRKALPVFTDVGKLLLKQYDTAAKVRTSQIFANRRIARQPNSSKKDLKQPSKNDLIFLEDSPNFCEKNLKHGSIGTKGRYCNASVRAKGVDGCEILCCGRRWKTEVWTRPENCRCKFIWCCRVTCDECMVTREYSKCK